MKTNKRGISLIVLIITIIVMIILAGAIILALESSGVVTNAQKAQFQNDIKLMEEELAVYITNKVEQTNGAYKKETLNANKDSLQESDQTIEGKTIKDVITSLSNNYLDEIIVVNGEIQYIGEDSNKTKWYNEMIFGEPVGDSKQVSANESGVVVIQDGSKTNLINYRIYGNSISQQYEQIEYIESTGTQYIDTGYIPNQKTKIKAIYEIPEDAKQETYAVICGTQNSANGYDAFCLFNAKSISARVGNWGTISTGIQLQNNVRYTVELEFNKIVVNGTSYTGTLEWKNEIRDSMYIFARNVNRTYLPNSRASAKLYKFEIYEDNILIKEFVPCYRKSDGVIGLYDTISKDFCENIGGILQKGNDINQINSIENVGDFDARIGKYVLSISATGKNMIDESRNYYVDDSAGAKVTDSQECYSVEAPSNAGGISWTVDNKFQVGDIISFQAKVKLNNVPDETITTSVTLRIWNATKKKWIAGGTNGANSTCSLINVGKEKILKLEGVKLTASNYAEGDTILFKITKGMGADPDPNVIHFDVYKGSVMVEEGSKATEYEPYINSVTNIYLDEPLRKVGDYVDYIDFRTQEVIRNVTESEEGLQILEASKKEKVKLPKIPLLQGISKISINTSVKSTGFEVMYYEK